MPRQHPGRLVALTVASEQLKIGHWLRLSPLNPYTSSILINLSRLHYAPEGHSLWLCVCSSVLDPPSLDPTQKATSRQRSCQRFPVGAYISLKGFDPTNGKTAVTNSYRSKTLCLMLFMAFERRACVVHLLGFVPMFRHCVSVTVKVIKWSVFGFSERIQTLL